MDDEYEILSHEEVERLKKEADKYKKNPFIKKKEDDKLYFAIVELTQELKKISSIFGDVKQQIIHEYQNKEGPDSKLDKVLEQNEYIARALVSFGESMNKTEEDSANDEVPGDYEELEKPSLDFDYSKESESMKKQSPGFDMDYQAWNYGTPNKPGVSKSSAEDLQKFKEEANRPDQKKPENVQKTNQKEELLDIPFPMEKEFEEQATMPKTESEEGFTPFGREAFQNSKSNNDVPDLKSISQERPRKKKKKSFRLF